MNRPAILINDLVVFESESFKDRVFKVKDQADGNPNSHFIWGCEVGFESHSGGMGLDPGNQLLPRHRCRHATPEEIAAAVARRIQG
jgi:hypothetical protein